MPTCLDAMKAAERTGFFTSARVLGQLREADCLQILLGDLEAEARIPASMQMRPNIGDLVMVAGANLGELFILSILETDCKANHSLRTFTSKDGSSVMLEEDQSSSAIKVFSKRNELLFEYDSATEKTHLHVAPGDLDIDVPGNICFRSGKTVELSGQEVRVQARSGAETAINQPDPKDSTSLSLSPGHIDVKTQKFGLRAVRGGIRVDEMKYAGIRLEAVVKSSRLFMDRVERTSKTVIERARNVYRTVEQLSQLRTGRMRTLVDSTYHMKSRKAYLKSEETFNIDGEKINLG